MSVLILAFMGLAWPSSVWLTQGGIEERRWWRPRKFIPWGEVTAVMSDKAGDKVAFGKFGQSIGLTRYHADPVGFEFEVRRRASLKETIDASALLTLGLEDYPRIPVGMQGHHKTTRKERKIDQNKSGGAS